MNDLCTTMPLGIAGFTYADLHEPARLRDLHDLFCARVAGRRSGALGATGTPTARAPDAPRSPIERSDLIVRDGAARQPVRRRAVQRRRRRRRDCERDTQQLDPLFRFKIDFVRKRALPLVKGGAHVAARSPQTSPSSRSWRGRGRTSTTSWRSPWPAARCSIAKRRCARRQRRGEGGRRGAGRRAEALVRRRACTTRPTGWVDLPVSRDARLLQPRAGPASAAGAAGGDARPRRPAAAARRLQAHRRALDAARGAQRDPLLRALPRARQGLVLEGAARQGRQRSPSNPLGIPLPGCPLDEKISEMHMLRKAGDAIGALAIVMIDNPMCPGHRPPHLQRLHEGLHLPEAGAGQHPADRDRRADRRAAACRGASRSTACSRAGIR